jgi:transcription-repair coupling factor (superfamily II helicase)
MQAATELEQHDIEQQLRRECQLITGVQFRNESAAFPRIEFGHRASRSSSSVIRFNITPQPLFHKNFDLLAKTLTDYQLKGYKIFILADSQKQQERLKEILR